MNDGIRKRPAPSWLDSSISQSSALVMQKEFLNTLPRNWFSFKDQATSTQTRQVFS